MGLEMNLQQTAFKNIVEKEVSYNCRQLKNMMCYVIISLETKSIILIYKLPFDMMLLCLAYKLWYFRTKTEFNACI